MYPTQRIYQEGLESNDDLQLGI
uniref:Uncharacterized protein n=1 Tax=Tetranychus urticae TaxID=32264 RepID=T1L4W5_TETUR